MAESASGLTIGWTYLKFLSFISIAMIVMIKLSAGTGIVLLMFSPFYMIWCFCNMNKEVTQYPYVSGTQFNRNLTYEEHKTIRRINQSSTHRSQKHKSNFGPNSTNQSTSVAACVFTTAPLSQTDDFDISRLIVNGYNKNLESIYNNNDFLNHSIDINPATGLTMSGELDVAGNPRGMNGQLDNYTPTTCDSFDSTLSTFDDSISDFNDGMHSTFDDSFSSHDDDW